MIEFDNEAERQMRHRTTRHGSSTDALGGPWLVSMVMWSNCMRFVGEEGVRVRDLERLARTKTNLNGMERWGYIVIEPDPADSRPRPPHSDWVIRATPAGRKAREVGLPLFGVIEKRWQERFGNDEIFQLRDSLYAVAGQLDGELPDCLPILGYGLFSKGPDRGPRLASAPKVENASSLPLSALLSRVLLAFAIEFERESEVSLAICANVLRFLGEERVRVRDLPLLSGVSKEAIATSLSYLTKRGYAVVKPESPGGSVKVLLLTPKGQRARDTYRRLLATIEDLWQARFGKDTIHILRDLLERLVGEHPTPTRHLYFAGWSLTLMGGERQSPNPAPYHTIPWCSTAAASPMAVDLGSPHKRAVGGLR